MACQAKLFILVNEVIQKIRTFVKDKKNVASISYRTLRGLGESLILYRDHKTGLPIYKSTEESFDEALFNGLITAYKLWEDLNTPANIVELATSCGLLLDDKVKDKVIALIGKDVYDRKKDAFKDKKEDFNAVVAKIKGMRHDLTDMPMPTRKKI